MADYYPLIARAVAGLDKNTGDARRMLYERAREALVTQLRASNPPLSESDITKERLALEEAIRKVEANTARRLRMEAQTQAAATSARPGEPVRAPEMPRPASPPPPPASPPRRDRLPPISGADPNPLPPPPSAKPSRDPAPARPPLSERLQSARKPLSDEGLKGFRDVVAETEGLGRATAQASKSAREAYAAVPTNAPHLDRLEPRVEPEGLRPATREPLPRHADKLAAPRHHDQPMPRSHEPLARSTEPPRLADPEFDAPPRLPPREMDGGPVEDRRSRRGLVAALVAVFLILALGGGVFWQRDRVALLFNAVKGSSSQTQHDAATTRPKITDRVGQPGSQEAAVGSPRSPSPNQAQAPVAQRVVLYEEDPADPSGKRYVGSAVWRMDTVASAAGQPPELAVRADVEIPERRITMTLTLRRNTDQTLPASHTIEIMFNLPADFPFGGITNVPGILMKQAEQTRGSPLAGLAVKVTSGFFLVGLSAVETDQQRNIQLLKERSWFDIPIVYNNGRRAILAVEKGTPGDRAFEEAFASWGQSK